MGGVLPLNLFIFILSSSYHSGYWLLIGTPTLIPGLSFADLGPQLYCWAVVKYVCYPADGPLSVSVRVGLPHTPVWLSAVF